MKIDAASKLSKTHALLPVVVFLLCSWFIRAEPLNVLVYDLTFTRPAAWKWEAPPTNTAAITQFIIPSATGAALTDVRFFTSDKKWEETRRSWREQFPVTYEKELHEEDVTIAQQKIHYFSQHGTYVLTDKSKKADYAFVGAHVPRPGKFVNIRMIGPRAEVEKSTSDFKKMIEEAVKEGQ